MNPLVSVVVPVYNAEKYIKECINSILTQTYDNIEIIAVNDGSTDRSLDILKSYSNKIRVISKENGGTATALNVGIKHMNGEWFKWLSADDLLCPTAIADLISYSNTEQNSEKCIMYGDHDQINSEGDIIKQFIEPNYNSMDDIYRNAILFDEFYGSAVTSIIHASAFEKYGTFDETLGFNEDYEMWLRLCVLYGFRLIHIGKTLGKYRIHGDQLSQMKLVDGIKHDKKIKQHILDQLSPEQQSLYKSEIKKINSTKPFGLRLRRKIRDTMLSILGVSATKPIIKFYRVRIKREHLICR